MYRGPPPARRGIDERVRKNQEEGKCPRREHQGDRSGADPGAPHPHLPLPALLHSLGLHDADAAGRRLHVRVEIRLRLLDLLAAALDGPLPWPHLGRHAETRRRRCLPPADRSERGLRQARHRTAGRLHPGEGRRALHQRQGRAEGRGRHVPPDRPLRHRAAGQGLQGDAAQRRQLRHARPDARFGPGTTPASSTSRPATIS